MPSKPAVRSWGAESTPAHGTAFSSVVESRGPLRASLTSVPFTSVLERPRRPARAVPLNGTATSRVTEPRIQYVRTTDGVDIAYYRIGTGQPLVALAAGGGLSHLAREWQYPEQRAVIEKLAASHRVFRLDHRGTGLSDRDVPFDLELAALDVAAVAEKENLQRIILFGQLHTAGAAILYAAQHPERVSQLILWSPFTNYREFLASSPPLQAARAAAAKDWVTYTELTAQLAAAWKDMDQSRRYAEYMRESTNENEYVASMERFPTFDVSAKLAALRMPVLVLHRREASFPSIALVSKLVGDIPGARLVLLSGAGAVPFLGDADAVLAAINDFVTPNAPRQSGGLTERETEILALLAEGNSNKGIARVLSISTRTVERHIGNVYTKIGAHNRAQATAYAFRQGIATRE
jgi:pimeloyl-ACP methyl ester carboxylesterase